MSFFGLASLVAYLCHFNSVDLANILSVYGISSSTEN